MAKIENLEIEPERSTVIISALSLAGSMAQDWTRREIRDFIVTLESFVDDEKHTAILISRLHQLNGNPFMEKEK